VDADAQRREDAGRLLLADLEAEARLRAAGDPLRCESAAVVEQAARGDAPLGEQVGEGEPGEDRALGLADAPGENLPAVDVLDRDHHRTADPTVREAGEDVELVAVDVDQLERLQVGDAALLRRERLAERIGPFPLGDDQPLVDLALELALNSVLQCGRARPRGAAKSRTSGIAAGPGRPLGPKIIRDEETPGVVVDLGLGAAALAAWREVREPVGAVDAFDQAKPAPEGRD
jgi:hypothetical protein